MQSMTRAEKKYFSVFHLFILTPDPSKPQWKFWGDIHYLQGLKITTKQYALTPKNNEAAGYLGPAEIELRKGAGLLGENLTLRASQDTSA